MCVTQEEMYRIFSKTGHEHGYESVSAEYSAFKDFKAFWERGYKYINLQISDYIMDAPPEAVESLAERIFSSIDGSEMPYNDSMKTWALSSDFIAKERPQYLRRSRNVKRDSKGMFRDLGLSLARLRDMKLIDNDDEVYITWTKEALASRTGYCSALMKTIVISSVFDMEDVPNSVVDFVVYYHHLIMKEARDTFGSRMSDEYIEKLKLYPAYRDAERWISERGLCL